MQGDVVLGFVVALAVSYGATLLFTPIASRLGARIGLVDKPRPGELQTAPVPRSGGYALIAAFLIALGISLAVVPRAHEEMTRIGGLIVGILLVVPIAFIDDSRRLGPIPQLAGQIGLAVLALAFGLSISSVANPFGGMVDFPLILAIPFTILWVVGMINTLNLIDSMDGVAAGVAAIAAVVLFVRSVSLGQYTISLLPLALAGVCFGFLRFNFNPARIIMGTSGSMFLGFSLAILALIGGAKIATAAFVLGLPIIDVGMVIIQRTLQRRSPLAGGDSAHLLHRLTRRGLSTRQITLTIYAVTAGGGALAMALNGVQKLWVALIVAAVALILALRFASARSADQPPR